MPELTKEEVAALVQQRNEEAVARAAERIRLVLEEEGCELVPTTTITAGTITQDIIIRTK